MNRLVHSSASLALIFASVVSTGSPASAATPDQRFGLKQIFDLQWAADPRIAPNGKRVVFVRSGFDVMEIVRLRTAASAVDCCCSFITPLPGRETRRAGDRHMLDIDSVP